MAAQETSALFSLSELMRLEQNRILEEEEQRKARVLAEENARREATRTVREQERARLALEENRRRDDAEREREHVVRLEAIRQAEIERIRVETEQRGRLEALSAQQQHEQKLMALETEAGKKKLSRALGWTLGLSAALIVGFVALYFGRLRPEIRNQVESLESLIQGQRQETEATQRALDAQNQKIRELEERVRKEKEQSIPLAKPDTETKRKVTPVQVAPKSQGGKTGADCTCVDPHDPLCGCLKR